MQLTLALDEPRARSRDPITSKLAAAAAKAQQARDADTILSVLRKKLDLPIKTLGELFDLNVETGVLTWKVRPRSHFSTTRGHINFNARFAGKPSGSPEGNGYLQCRITIDGKCRLFKAHRIVWALVHGRWPDHEVDHENLNRADNRPSNLRPATGTENACNRIVRSDSLTGAKGVRFDPDRQLFRARIGLHGKSIHLGRHETIEEASAAYAKAAASLHGDFARVEMERAGLVAPTGRTVMSTAGRQEREWSVR